MPTVKPTKPTGVQFSETYPEDLAERLAWFARELGVREEHLLGLLGLAPAEVPALPGGGVDWRAVVAAHENEAWWVEALLYDTLALFNYDAAALRDFLRRDSALAYDIPQPGGGSLSARSLPPAERHRALLLLLASGGPDARRALLAYLAEPGDPATSAS